MHRYSNVRYGYDQLSIFDCRDFYFQNAIVTPRAHYVGSNLRDFTGLGYMDLGLGGMIELRYPVIPWTGEYNIYVRADPKSHGQELEMTLIREDQLRFNDECKKAGAEDEPRDLITLKSDNQ